MINRDRIDYGMGKTEATVKIVTYESTEAVIDMLAEFTRLNHPAEVESFTVKTTTVARYNRNRAARLEMLEARDRQATAKNW